MKNEDVSGNSVFVYRESSRHVRERHGITMSNYEIARFVDACNPRQDGIYVISTFSGKKTFVLRGAREVEGRMLRVFRTMWLGDEEKYDERTGLPVFRIVHPELKLAKQGVGIVPYFSG